MSVGLPHKKRSTFFWPVEGNLGLRIPGVYWSPCEFCWADRLFHGHQIKGASVTSN
jgi:hypothetical protein